MFLSPLLDQSSELWLNPWNVLYQGWLIFQSVSTSSTMGRWAMCSPQDSGNVQSLEVLASSALCRLWGLKTIFRFCEQWQLPNWALTHCVPANTVLTSWSYELTQDSPVAPSVKNLLQYRRPKIDPWVGKIPWRREWQPTPAFLTRGAWWATVHGVKEKDPTEV